MGLFDWLGSKIDGHATPRAKVEIPDARNLTGHDIGLKAIAEQHYVRLWISDLFLKNDNKWFSSRFPLVYSLIGLDYGGQRTELANISGKNRFAIQQADLGRSILQGYPLTPLLPFHGGTIEMDCGLVSMQADNVLQDFAGVVSDIAAKVNVPQVSQVVGIAGSIASGVQSLLGAGNAQTMLYVHQTFQADTLNSGYIFLSDRKQEDIDPSTIWMTTDGVRQGSARTALCPLDPQNYLVLRIEVTQERDDWRSLPAIAEPLEAAIDAKFSGDDAKARLLLGQAKLAAFKSKDLTRLDTTRVIKGIDAEFGAPLAAGGGTPPKMDAATLLARAAQRTPIEAALAAPITEQELVASLAPGGW